MRHQFIERDVGIVDLGADAVDNFTEIVGRNIRCHADRDAGAAVDQQIWKGRWENGRLGARLVVIRNEIDRVLFHVGHERGAEMRHARFGVTHRRRRIAFDRAEIALTIDQPLAHRPGLRHVHERRIDHGFAVRMIITARVAADFCALAMLPIGKKGEIVHRVENSSLRWLESVARVRQGARNDYRHRVIEK